MTDLDLPPFVTSPMERRRWDLCVSIATTCSECCEETGVADPMFVAITAPLLYASDLPTGDDDDVSIRRSSAAPWRLMIDCTTLTATLDARTVSRIAAGARGYEGQ